VRDVYIAIDAAIGRIVAAAGPDTDVIVLSVTGMCANYGGNHVLDEILRRLEGDTAPRSLDWLLRAKRAVKGQLPRDVRRRWRRTAGHLEEAASRSDRERRRCFALPHNDLAGAVRVNLSGREPSGRIQPGPHYDAFFAELRRDLLDVRNLDTGRPIATEVLRTDVLCPARRVGHARFLRDLEPRGADRPRRLHEDRRDRVPAPRQPHGRPHARERVLRDRPARVGGPPRPRVAARLRAHDRGAARSRAAGHRRPRDPGARGARPGG
jgi:hypothetical protein